MLLIPETKQALVALALQTAFGVSDFETITELTAGLSSALIYKITVSSKPYLLRIIMSMEAVADPSRWFGNMATAAEVGVAPRVWYMNAEDKICITDFVDAQAFSKSEARKLLPGLLHQLHTLPPFPKRMDYLQTMDGFVQKFLAAKALPDRMLSELITGYEKIKAVYPPNEEDLVASHNDLKPDNILFDGKRAWLVDWEAAFLNDRYLDLSVVANFLITNEAEEVAYLTTYFGMAPSDYQLACFFLMNQLLHWFYFTFFLFLCTKKGVVLDSNITRPDFRTFHDELWEGNIYLLDPKHQQQYAFLHMERLRDNLRLKRFEESLAIVARHHIA